MAEDVALRQQLFHCNLFGVLKWLWLCYLQDASLSVGGEICGEEPMQLAYQLRESGLLPSKCEHAAFVGDGLGVSKNLTGGDGRLVNE